jgi:Zn-dependent protease
MTTDLIFSLVILIISVILHEVAHGYMADWLGDPTARLQGRLTLNPLSHIDPMGSIILPALLVFTHSPMLIGYAKPVPYNPYNLAGKYDEGLVAFAGPGTNIALALIFGLTIRFAGASLSPSLVGAFAIITYVNLALALFNLIPLPPLDGSKVLGALFEAISEPLARAYETFLRNFERMGVLTMTLLILIIFYFLLAPLFGTVMAYLLQLLTGQAL